MHVLAVHSLITRGICGYNILYKYVFDINTAIFYNIV